MRMMMLFTCLVLWTVVVFADERNFDFDRHTDFSTFKTFALGAGKVDSPRPELNNALVVKKIGDAIRAELAKKGLKETANYPDLVVDYSITGEDYSAHRGGRVSSSQSTLVIDLLKRSSKTLVWRSVYRDVEKNNARLAQKLPRDVKKSLSEYPPRTKNIIESSPIPPAIKRELTPKEAALAALDIIQAARQDTGFVGPGVHPGLDVNLNRLEREARAVAEDNGRNPAISDAKAKGLFKAILETAGYATSIANRFSETADARARARDLAAKLQSLTTGQ